MHSAGLGLACSPLQQDAAGWKSAGATKISFWRASQSADRLCLGQVVRPLRTTRFPFRRKGISRASFPRGIRLSALVAAVLAAWVPAFAPAGSVDSGFPSAEIIVAPSDHYGLALQGDGKILVGGTFVVDGVYWEGVARLLPDGQPDRGFARVEIDHGIVCAIAVQHDGKILVGGSFSTVNGGPRSVLIRLAQDGTVEEAFEPFPDPVSGAAVHCLEVDALGRILVGGHIRDPSSGIPSNVVRILSDGSHDLDWESSFASDVLSLEIAANDRILIGGPAGLDLLGAQGGYLSNLFVLVSDAPTPPAVSSILELPDGGIHYTLAVGTPHHDGNVPRGMLLADGAPDSAYDPDWDQWQSYASSSLHSGGVIVCAGRRYWDREDRVLIQIIDFAGEILAALSGEGRVRNMLIQPDGCLLAAGMFSEIHGVLKSGLARIEDVLPPHSGKPRRVRLWRDGRLRFRTQEGVPYVVEQTEDLDSWAPLWPETLWGSGNMFETTVDMSGPQRFIRVQGTR